MKRPLFAVGMIFAVATWASFLLAPDSLLRLLVSGALALTGAAFVLLRRPFSRGAAVVCLCAALAVVCQMLYWQRAAAPLLAEEGETVRVEGVITAVTAQSRSFDYTARVRFPDRPDLPHSSTVQIRAWGEMDLAVGSAFRCEVRLAAFPSARGAHTAAGEFVRGYLVDGTAELLPRSPFELTRLFVDLRGWMRQNLYARLPGREGEVLAAMALGLRDTLPAELANVFNRSGTVHLLAVSGLHLSIVTGCLLELLRVLRFPGRLRCLLGGMGAVLFACLVGFSPTITRSLVMMLIWLAAQALSRRSDSLSSLGLSLLLICLLWPHWMLSRSLWLSAASTAGIARFYRPLYERMLHLFGPRSAAGRRFLALFVGAFAVSLSAYAFTLPILMATTGWISLIAPLANLFVAPFTAIALAGGLLCAALPLGVPLGAVALLARACVAAIIEVSTLLAGLPFAVFALDEGYLLLWLLGSLAMGALLLRRRARRELCLCAAALSLLCLGLGSISLSAANQNKVEAVAIDQCDPLILLRGGDAVLVGAPDRYEIGRLLRYLNFRGVESVSALIAYDCGEQIDSGLLALAERYEIGCVVGPDDAYILDQLACALPGTRVFSGGYAEIELLGGVRVRDLGGEYGAVISAGEETVVKLDGEYGIIEETQPVGAVRAYRNGALAWPRHLPPLIEPVGRMLFGETRLLLEL